MNVLRARLIDAATKPTSGDQLILNGGLVLIQQKLNEIHHPLLLVAVQAYAGWCSDYEQRLTTADHVVN